MNEQVIDFTRAVVADNNLFVRNQHHHHTKDGFANEVFVIVNGGTGTRILRLGSEDDGCEPFIPTLESSHTPFTFVHIGVLWNLFHNDKGKLDSLSVLSEQMNYKVYGSTTDWNETKVIVCCGSTSVTLDERLFQVLLRDSSVLREYFPSAAFVVLGAEEPPSPIFDSFWTAVVAPSKFNTSIYDSIGSASAAPCRLVLFKATHPPSRRWVDCTHIVTPSSPFFPGGQVFLRCPASRGGAFAVGEHSMTDQSHAREVIITGCDVGTHMDSPRHFFAHLPSISDLSVSSMAGVPLVIVDITAKCEIQDRLALTSPVADYAITVDDLVEVQNKFGSRAQWNGALVIANTGWWKRFVEAQKENDAEIYKTGGLPKGNLLTTTGMWFPGFSQEAAAWLLECNVHGIGIDTLSLDCGSSTEFPVHNTMLGAGKYQIENVDLSPFSGLKGHQVGRAFAAPMLVEGAFESQTRLMLNIEDF